ncbi:thyroid transcription factor 1-associated protein 26-like [Tribolium madens]|uniref:thyroid transcription factor 1-associated protein 26-like n=1 Tax=Tribolium madens TaxID=41895 RepID=UPI001CF7369F|nr:thyroid transcription factor 1-associated protein 26-like [Tribolium madens]
MVKNKLIQDGGQKTRDNFFRKTLSKKVVKPSTSGEGSDDLFAKKRPFNKNKWRSEKYSFKNKLENWKDKRTEYIRHGYYKEQNREKNKFDVNKIYEEEERREKREDEDTEQVKEENGLKRHKKSFKERIQEEKEAKRAEFLRKKAEKEEALQKYQKAKMEKFKKLNKKTKRGQPVMKGRIEYLLEKIQRSVSDT